MIVIAGHLILNPSKREALNEALLALVDKTQAEEGNLDYRYGADLSVPDRINFFERWESEEALNAHMGSAHMAEFMGQALDYMGGPAEIVRYDVSGSSKLL